MICCVTKNKLKSTVDFHVQLPFPVLMKWALPNWSLDLLLPGKELITSLSYHWKITTYSPIWDKVCENSIELDMLFQPGSISPRFLQDYGEVFDQSLKLPSHILSLAESTNPAHQYHSTSAQKTTNMESTIPLYPTQNKLLWKQWLQNSEPLHVTTRVP